MKKTIKRAEGHLQNLCAHLDGKITKEHGIFSMQVGKNVGSGQIKCISSNRCITAFEFDISLHRPIEVPLHMPGTEFLYFSYMLEGKADLNLGNTGQCYELEPFQTLVTYSSQEHRASLSIPKNTRIVYTLIGIDKIRYKKETGHGNGISSEKLRLLLDEFGNEKKQVHQGKYNLRVGEQVKLLHQQDWNNDISSHLSFNGLCNMILANQINQYYLDIACKASGNSALTKNELEQVREISDFIKNYPEIQHSIKELSLKSGLSPNKLQEGFKFTHLRTVSDFIRTVRIEKAEHLIKTTDMNISEVVYSIGLTSRSYFCKIFKNKYGCSPKQYQNKANAVLLEYNTPDL